MQQLAPIQSAPPQPEFGEADKPTSPWRRAAVSAFAVWLGSVVAYGLITVSSWRATHTEAPPLRDLLGAWFRWDAIAYVEIALHGYVDPSRPAFFPLYPLLVRGADLVLPGGPLLAAMAVSAACSYVALLLMHRLAQHEFGSEVAQRAVTYLAAFPTAFFLFAAYNESLFIALAVGAFYCMRTGRWWVAGALCGLASGTRMFGLLLAIPMAVEYLRQHGWGLRHYPWRRIRPDILSLALVPAGTVGYALYCWVALGDPLVFSRAQQYWERSYEWPGAVLWHAIQDIQGKRVLGDEFLGGLMEIVAPLAAIALLVLAVVGPWRFRPNQVYLLAYAVPYLIFLMCTEVGYGRPLQSTPRFLLEFVPIFLVLARMGGHVAVDRVIVFAGLTLNAVLLLTFFNWGFVA